MVAAVERRLSVEASPSERWSACAGDVRWREGEAVPAALSFVVSTIEAARAKWGTAPHSLTTSDELKAEGHKLGLGGSAAAVVATAAALGTGASREAIWALADEVHRAVQGGKGSGADVAASVHGGVVRYTRKPRQVRPLAIHPSVRLLLVWTGESVKTTPRLERWQAFLREDPAAAQAFAAASREAVRALEDALASGTADSLRGAIGRARAALKGLEEGLGLELETAALRTASEAAWAAGACGKLSGAGGGDCAIVLASGDEAAARAHEAIAATGLEVFPAVIAAGGVRVTRTR